MAYEQFGPYIAAKAAADLSASQYLAVKIDANGQVALAGAGDGIGILANDPAQGEAATVQIAGVAKWKAGAAFSAGAKLTADANGKAVAATTLTAIAADADPNAGDTTGSLVLGIALKAASGADEIVPVLLVHQGPVPVNVV